jgi:hypothetical protein
VEEDSLEISFKNIQPLVPGYIFNEYGQLTGNFVRYADIYCVAENGRVQIWLNRASYESQDPERLICDYDEKVIREMLSKSVE